MIIVGQAKLATAGLLAGHLLQYAFGQRFPDKTIPPWVALGIAAALVFVTVDVRRRQSRETRP